MKPFTALCNLPMNSWSSVSWTRAVREGQRGQEPRGAGRPCTALRFYSRANGMALRRALTWYSLYFEKITQAAVWRILPGGAKVKAERPRRTVSPCWDDGLGFSRGSGREVDTAQYEFSKPF